MFYKCESLEYLNIKFLKTLDAIYSDNMFKDVGKNLTVIFIPKITGEKIKTQITKNFKYIEEEYPL